MFALPVEGVDVPEVEGEYWVMDRRSMKWCVGTLCWCKQTTWMRSKRIDGGWCVLIPGVNSYLDPEDFVFGDVWDGVLVRPVQKLWCPPTGGLNDL